MSEQFFTRSPYFPPADPTPIQTILRDAGTARRFRKGELLKPMDRGERLFLVEEGACIYRHITEQQPVIPMILLPGRTMGDISLLAQKHYQIEWRALSDGLLWVVPPDVLTHTVMRSHNLALLKTRNIINKEESALEALTTNLTKPGSLRLKIFLKGLLYETDRFDGEWLPLPFRIPAEVMGMVINLNRTNVSRLIGQWRKAGLARRVGHDLWVHRTLFTDVNDWITPGA